jgi:Skp family chaperone for outer membrane proteins
LNNSIWEDPIVAEVRRNREAIFDEYGGDMKRYQTHLQELEKELKAQGWKFETPDKLEARKASQAAAGRGTAQNGGFVKGGGDA